MAVNPHKKRVVFILPHMNPGGAERVLVTLMNNLPRNLYDIHFVCLSDSGKVAQWIDADISVTLLKKGSVRKGLFALYKILGKIRPDVVFTTMTHSNGGVLLLKPFFKFVRFIVRESSLPSAIISQYGKKGRLFRYVYKFLYPLADTVVLPSAVIVDELEGMGMKTDNYRVLFNPVNEEKIRDGLSFPKREADEIRFVCVGRLTFEKGYTRLIEALKNFSSPHNWVLDIVGGGELEGALAKQIKQEALSDRVFLRGHQDYPWQWMAEADCLLLPSLIEGMPNAALESLVCGTPVIGHSDAGGIADIAKYSDKVQVAEDMGEFIAMMEKVSYRTGVESQLPEVFKLDRVMAEFMKVLGNG